MNVDNACTLFETAPRVLGDEKFGLDFIEKNAEDVIQTHGIIDGSSSFLPLFSLAFGLV
jgi:hypothetical protein